ncbi:MAG: glycosyltransferase family 2 protein [Candidatus Schekmanbacteria bacterium]|nr:MAG: glycosyltransferase family 2 protein [Candidatus Schekmanbacteria bacterium]
MHSVSVIIPAYNEVERISSALESLSHFFSNFPKEYEIIIVNDGSTDGTEKLVKDFIKNHIGNMSLINLDKNCGKGMAVKKGVENATKDIIIFLDADLSYGPENITRALEEFKDSQRQIIIGNRNMKESRIINPPPLLRRISGKIYSLLVQTLVLPGISDSQCGFKAFRKDCAKEIFKRLTIFRFGFDVEILYIAMKLGYNIKKMPVVCTNAQDSRVHLFSDSFRMFTDLFTIRANDKKGLYR